MKKIRRTVYLFIQKDRHHDEDGLFDTPRLRAFRNLHVYPTLEIARKVGKFATEMPVKATLEFDVEQ